MKYLFPFLAVLSLALASARATTAPVLADDTSGALIRPTNLVVSSPLYPIAHSGVILTGTASTRIYGSGGAVGTLPFTALVAFKVPPVAPTAVNGILALSSSATTTAQNNSLEVSIKTTGDLLITLNDVAGTSKRDVVIAGFVGTYAGRAIQLAVVRDKSTGLAVYLNDALATTTETVTGSPAAWTAASITATYLDLGFTSSSTVYSGTIYGASIYTVALSAADVAGIFNNGGAVPAGFRWASTTSVVPTSYGYSYGATDAATASGGGDYQPSAALSAVSGTRTGGAGSYVERVTFATGYSLAEIYNSKWGPPSGGGGVGQKTRLQFWAKGSGSFSFNMNFQQSSGGGLRSNTVTFPVTTSWAFYDAVFTFTAAGASGVRVEASGRTSGDYVDIDDMVAVQAGAVANYAMDEGVGYQAQDAAPGAAHLTLTTGTSHEISKRRGAIRWTTTGTGNAQLMGQQALPANARITSWTIDASGGTTVSLGNVSAGTQFASGVSLSTGLNDITLTTRFCSTNNLWCNSGTAVTLQHTVTYEIVD